MRELTYVGERAVEWRERPDPVLESRFDAIVRPVAATTCDVDKAILLGRAPPFPRRMRSGMSAWRRWWRAAQG
jgi:hypothetical protein